MKNRALQKDRVDEIKHFIRSSCEGCTDRNSRHLDFHKNLITHYFQARNVKIYYEERKVVAEIPVVNGYTTINFGCLDLPTFLASCIKEDEESQEIYMNYIKNCPSPMLVNEEGE